MFFGLVIKPGQEVLPDFAQGKSVLHISRACLSNHKEDGNVYLQVEGSEGWLNICCLKKNVREDAALDLFFMKDDKKKLRISGSKCEIHLVGYYELAMDGESLDDDVMLDYENSKFEHFPKKKKAAVTNGKVKGKFSDEDETNAGDDDAEDDDEPFNDYEEDDDNEDDEEEDEDDEDEEDEEEAEEDDDEEDDEEEDDEDEDDEDEDEDEDEEDEDEDEEEEDDNESKEDGGDADEDGEKNKKVTKKKDQGKNKKNSVSQNKKRSMENKDEQQVTKKSKTDAEDIFEKSVVAYLKQHGKCKLSELGKVKKPENFKTKLGVFIKSRPNVFKMEKNGEIVKLASSN